ncbi:MAG: TraB/GumN family protein [Xanthomonadaceae bacterium]|nr:TraB/GumN family protein [Xanthomonadaceae bacterium]
MTVRLMIAVVLVFCAGTLQAAGLGWRVADADGGTAYLVGTIHAARETLYPLPDPLLDAFAHSEILVVEVDVGAIDPRAAQRISAEHGVFPRDGSLRALLTDDAWTRAAAWSERLGVPRRNLNRMRPWLAAVTLVSLEIRQLGLDPEFGVERYFASRARARSMRIVELESLTEQLTTLAALPPATQVAFLEGSIPTGDGFRLVNLLEKRGYRVERL